MRIVLILLSAFFFANCAHYRDFEIALDRIESQVRDNPALAQKTLDSIAQFEFTNLCVESRYVLLDTYCKYRLNKEGKDDTRIRKAEAYFYKKGNHYQKMMALFLHAQILKNAGFYHESMMKFKESLYEGEKIEDHFMLGQIYTQMFLLCIPNTDSDQLLFAQKALSEYQQYQDSLYILDGEINLAISYYNQHQYDSCVELLNQTKEKAILLKDTLGFSKSLLFLAECEISRGNYYSAFEYLQTIQGIPTFRYTSRSNTLLAMTYAGLHQKDSALHYLQLASKETDTTSKLNNYLFYASKTYASLGDYKQALAFSNRYHHHQDSIYAISLKNSVMKAQKDFSDARWKESEKRSQLFLIGIFMLMLVLLSSTISFYFYRKQKTTKLLMQDKEMKHKAEQLQMQEYQMHLLEEQLRLKEENRKTAIQCIKQSPLVLCFRQALIGKYVVREEDWSALYELFTEYIPSYEQQLRAKHSLNDIEWKICQLVKLEFSPSDIAVLTHREKSSISAIRSRLFSKMFQIEGSTKELDDFLMSI
ncbi:MAG: hypothetical protein IJP70_01015 [Bacteroidales bacterium]|nr:hypothetical protein [Bacteroidales bacterium]